MTRKTSGLWSLLTNNRAPLASLAVVGTLACLMALAGCGSSKPGGPPVTVNEGGTDAPVLTACTTPTFMPGAGMIAAGGPVTLTAAGLPTNGFIYYTTDGTIPTHASPAYSAPIPVNTSETIHAIAYAMGACGDSAVATAAYTVPGMDAGPMLTACGSPTFMPAAGAVAAGTTVAIVPPAGFPMTFPQGNAQIFYTTDGTLPTHTSSAYSGPIQINSAETIHAIAYYAGTCTDSTPALAAYTITTPTPGTLGLPAFNPPSATQSNDFLVQLTDTTAAATICFTFGTGMPTCTSTATAATCSGTSQTYNAGAGLGATGSVTINGAVSSATGTVTVNAIACAPGATTTTAVTQVYTLKAAAPTMQGPAPSAGLPYVAAGYAPTLASTTTGSTIRYTTDGSAPTCTTGTLLTALGVAANPAAVPGFTGNSTFNAITCKNGYAPSAVGGPFVYGIVLPSPAFVDATTTTLAEGTGIYDGAPSIDFTDTAPGAFICYTTDSSAPTCGATAGACTHGTADTVVGSTPTPVAITATGTVLTAVACSLTSNPSAPATATYTLMLDPPGLESTPGGLPGCSETNNAGTSCLANPPTTPVLSYNIPTAAAGTYQPFIEETIGKVPPSATQAQYQFVCTQKGAATGLACTPTGCSAGASLISSAMFQTPLTVPLAPMGTVVAGDSWSIIGCPGSTSPGFQASAVTTVGFALPGAAPSPVVTTSTASDTYNNPVTPTFSNSGMTAENVCYGIYPSGTPPTTAVACTTAGGCAATVGYASSNGGTGGVALGVPAPTTVSTTVTVTAGGAGYTSTPAVTIDNPPAGTGALTAQAVAVVNYSVAVPATPTTGGAGCSAANPIVTFSTGTATATATINSANVVTGLTIKNPGSGYTAVPTPVFTNLGCTTAPTFTPTLINGTVVSVTVNNQGMGYLAVPAVTFSGGGGSGAAATAALTAPQPQAVLPSIQADKTLVDVVGCIAGAPLSALKTYTYDFTEPTPTVVDTTVGPTANVVAGTVVPLDDQLTLTATTTFGTPAAPKVCYTTDGTTPSATCATAGSTVCVANGTALAATAAAFTTNTLKAIACDPTSQTAQLNSAPYSAALSLVVGTPNPPAALAGGTYYNLVSPTLVSSTTSGAPVICYTTTAGSAPTCNGTGCTGGSLTYGGAIPITSTGSVLKAIACEGAFSSATSTNTYTYQVSPIILANVPTLPLAYSTTSCPAAIDVGLDCSEGSGMVKGCSTATFNAGGATTGATVCYSTDGTAVNSCTAVMGHIICGTAGTLHTTVNALQSIPVTINALACASGFANSAATLPVTVTPYSAAITFTGNPFTDFVVAPTNEDAVSNSAGGGNSYLSTTASTLYVGMDGIAHAPATYTVVYLGNGVAAGAATASTPAISLLPPMATAAGFQYAVQFPTEGTAATLYAWSSGTTAWVAQPAASAPAITVKADMTAEEFSIALSALPQLGANPATITMYTTEITNAGALGAGLAWSAPAPAAFPQTHWFAHATGSCLYPADPLSIH